MATAVVTGSGGLVGSATVRRLASQGFRVLGIENDMRSTFFGPDASTSSVTGRLQADHEAFESRHCDIRDRDAVERVFADAGDALELVVHAAAQPSHDWAASDPHADFSVNAVGTINLLEATRNFAPTATFVLLSTNKVYGDRPNELPLVEGDTRLELPVDHHYHSGIDTSMSIDRCTHSLFGVSKAAADLATQEYGRYFGMPTACLRGGCLTGPQHAGAMLHGFLAYLMRCTVTGDPYTVFGYDGKQVRDNLHADDVASAIMAIHAAPRPGAVYNLGGGRRNSVSMLEAIEACERIGGRRLAWDYSDEARVGDHRWWISDLSEFQRDYPDWSPQHDVDSILTQIYEANAERWEAGR